MDERDEPRDEWDEQDGEDPQGEDPEAILCPVCDTDVGQGGPCEHVVCAYERLDAPAVAGSRCLAHFLHSRLPQEDVERLCAALAGYAASHPDKEAWAELPGLLHQTLKSMRRRQARWGGDAALVSCDEIDGYLSAHLQACEGYLGGEALEGYGAEQGPVSSVLFHIHFAQDVPAVAEQVSGQMREDAALLERLTRERGEQDSGQAPPPGPRELSGRPGRRALSRSDYFPPGLFDDFVVSWYGACLEALEEPSLFLASGEDPSLHAYRFLWLRTFHEPVAVRLTVSGAGGGQLVLKVADGLGGYEPGDLELRQARPVAPEAVAGFLARLERIGFWGLPTRSHDLGFDGAQWILEGVRRGRYHLVDRWSPKEDGGDRGFREAALTLLHLAELPVERVY